MITLGVPGEQDFSQNGTNTNQGSQGFIILESTIMPTKRPGVVLVGTAKLQLSPLQF